MKEDIKFVRKETRLSLGFIQQFFLAARHSLHLCGIRRTMDSHKCFVVLTYVSFD